LHPATELDERIGPKSRQFRLARGAKDPSRLELSFYICSNHPQSQTITVELSLQTLPNDFQEEFSRTPFPTQKLEIPSFAFFTEKQT
jgi:hypothetical protein